MAALFSPLNEYRHWEVSSFMFSTSLVKSDADCIIINVNLNLKSFGRFKNYESRLQEQCRPVPWRLINLFFWPFKRSIIGLVNGEHLGIDFHRKWTKPRHERSSQICSMSNMPKSQLFVWEGAIQTPSH